MADTAPRHRSPTIGRRMVRRGLVGMAVVGLSALGAVLAGEVARRQAEQGLATTAQASAALHSSVLRSELERYRLVPVVLAEDSDMAALLSETTPTPASTRDVNLKLERLAAQTRVAVIYLLDDRGVARAASNWNLPTSFVGSDYGFRPYFSRAMAGGDAEFFALGTVSGRPGLFLARRITGKDGRRLGVAVVKVEFDALETDWRQSGEPAYVSDPNGVVLITSVPQWRFRTVAPMTPLQRDRVQAGQTLGHDALGPLPFRALVDGRPGLVTTTTDDAPVSPWMSTETATSTPGWTLHLLSPAGDTIRVAVANARAVAALLILLLGLGLTFLIHRRRREAALTRTKAQARLELERRVEDRTRDLHAAEVAREILRDELVQANKLATLGQIAAGVAHEINQPVATIRTQSDTARTYLDRQDDAGARRALTRIEEMTERVGRITDELRAFSRKSPDTPAAVAPDAVIDAALVLLTGRLGQSGVEVSRIRADRTVRAMADPVRLEQVIVNLIQNAVEAMDTLSDHQSHLHIAVLAKGDDIQITVVDNGPGVAPAVAEALFTPFQTTKTLGLGLGLVICRDILAAVGGDLSLGDTDPSGGGARFVISLRRA